MVRNLALERRNSELSKRQKHKRNTQVSSRRDATNESTSEQSRIAINIAIVQPLKYIFLIQLSFHFFPAPSYVHR